MGLTTQVAGRDDRTRTGTTLWGKDVVRVECEFVMEKEEGPRRQVSRTNQGPPGRV